MESLMSSHQPVHFSPFCCSFKVFFRFNHGSGNSSKASTQMNRPRSKQDPSGFDLILSGYFTYHATGDLNHFLLSKCTILITHQKIITRKKKKGSEKQSTKSIANRIMNCCDTDKKLLNSGIESAAIRVCSMFLCTSSENFSFNQLLVMSGFTFYFYLC